LLSKMATQQHRSKYDVSMKTLYRKITLLLLPVHVFIKFVFK